MIDTSYWYSEYWISYLADFLFFRCIFMSRVTMKVTEWITEVRHSEWLGVQKDRTKQYFSLQTVASWRLSSYEMSHTGFHLRRKGNWKKKKKTTSWTGPFLSPDPSSLFAWAPSRQEHIGIFNSSAQREVWLGFQGTMQLLWSCG